MAMPQTLAITAFGTPVVAKYERESVAGWGFVGCEFARLKKMCRWIHISLYRLRL